MMEKKECKDKAQKNAFVKYWHIWSMLIAILLPLGLYGLIQQPWGYDAIGDEKAPEVWLGFWGGYIGSIITSAVAIIILYSQLNANHKENEETRELQIKNIEYQQRMQWLNDFKKVAAEYIMVFNCSDLVVAQNKILSDPRDSYNITKDVLNNLRFSKTTINLHKGNDEATEALMDELNSKRKIFFDVAMDIYKLSVFQLNNKKCTDVGKRNALLKQHINNSDNGFSEELKLIVTTNAVTNDRYCMTNIIRKRRKSIAGILDEVSEPLTVYINDEQQRINNILLQ